VFRALLAKLKGPAAIYLLAGILTRLGFILLIPLYTRKLNAAEYGDYILAQTALTLAPAFVLGLPAALSRFYFDSPDQAISRTRVGGVAKLTGIVTVSVAAVMQALIVLLVPASATGLFARWSLTCVLVAAAGNVLAVVPVQFLRDAQKPVAAAAFQLAEFLLIVGTGILFVSGLRRGLNGSLEALASTYAALGVTSIVFTYAYLGGTISRTLAKEALRFSVPYVPHFLALWVQGVADRWTMRLSGAGPSLGPYSLASQLSTTGTLVVNAWNMERSPRTGEIYREGGLSAIRRDMPRMVQSYMIASAVPSAVLVAATPLLRLFVGARFYSALWYLPVLLLFNFIDSLYFPGYLVVYYDGKSRWISTVTGVSAVASIALSAAFVPLFGVWGAILARGAASLLRTSSLGFAASRCFALARRK
jgi:O-antigen/teichoic acid export membrane protein